MGLHGFEMKASFASVHSAPRTRGLELEGCGRQRALFRNELVDKGFIVTSTDKLITWARTDRSISALSAARSR